MAKTKQTNQKEAAVSKDKKANGSQPAATEENKKKKTKNSKVSSGSISMYLAEIFKFNPLPPEREV